MLLIPFIVAVIALVIFVVEYNRNKTLAIAGLAVLTAAWILTQTLDSGTNVHFQK